MPVDLDQRHEVLKSGQADVSIVFTTDPQIKRDKRGPAQGRQGHVPALQLDVPRQARRRPDKAGPDLQKTIDLVNKDLTAEVDAGAQRARRPRQGHARRRGGRLPQAVQAGELGADRRQPRRAVRGAASPCRGPARRRRRRGRRCAGWRGRCAGRRRPPRRCRPGRRCRRGTRRAGPGPPRRRRPRTPARRPGCVAKARSRLPTSVEAVTETGTRLRPVTSPAPVRSVTWPASPSTEMSPAPPSTVTSVSNGTRSSRSAVQRSMTPTFGQSARTSSVEPCCDVETWGWRHSQRSRETSVTRGAAGRHELDVAVVRAHHDPVHRPHERPLVRRPLRQRLGGRDRDAGERRQRERDDDEDLAGGHLARHGRTRTTCAASSRPPAARCG